MPTLGDSHESPVLGCRQLTSCCVLTYPKRDPVSPWTGKEFSWTWAKWDWSWFTGLLKNMHLDLRLVGLSLGSTEK